MKKQIYIIVSLVVLLIIIGSVLMFSNKTGNIVSVSTPASLTLVSPIGGSVDVGSQTAVRWISNNYSNDSVAVNIIRKVSDSPARYELVRTVAMNTRDDGSAVWVPAKTDIGANTFVEVGCTLSSQECKATTPTLALAVVDTGLNSNTAAAYDAIEKSFNQ